MSDTKSKIEEALALFADGQGFSCSQSVLAAYGEELGLTREQCLKIGTAFGGGIARTADICGAVTGAYMVLGLKHGRASLDDAQAKEKTYELVHEFSKRFTERNGSLRCRDLLECDISTPEGQQHADECQLFRDVCPKMVRDAMEILAELLGEE